MLKKYNPHAFYSDFVVDYIVEQLRYVSRWLQASDILPEKSIPAKLLVDLTDNMDIIRYQWLSQKRDKIRKLFQVVINELGRVDKLFAIGYVLPQIKRDKLSDDEVYTVVCRLGSRPDALFLTKISVKYCHMYGFKCLDKSEWNYYNSFIPKPCFIDGEPFSFRNLDDAIYALIKWHKEYWKYEMHDENGNLAFVTL